MLAQVGGANYGDSLVVSPPESHGEAHHIIFIHYIFNLYKITLDKFPPRDNEV